MGAAPTRTITKLSYKEERRAAELNTLLPQLTAEIRALELQLDDPGFFARDPAAFNTVTAKLESVRKQRDAAENEWLEIELKREHLASQ